MEETKKETLRYATWSSDMELSFYSSLASLKINHDKLNDAARKVVGRYEVQPMEAPERSTRMQLQGNAFTADDVPSKTCRAEGTIKNVNTIEDYRNLDRTAVLKCAGRTIWDAIVDGTIYSCPSLLSSFYAVFFADLKKYKFTYHYLFPALHSNPAWELVDDLDNTSQTKLSASESTLLFGAVQTWRYRVDSRQRGFFLAKRVRPSQSDQSSDRSPTSPESPDARPETPHTPTPEDVGFHWVVDSLASYEKGFFQNVSFADRFVCFVDPSTYPKNPGWMLRNLLVLVRQRWKLSDVQILAYRDTHARREQANSLIFRFENPGTIGATPSTMPKVTGWERTDNNLRNRTVDLAEYMDPTRLADQSVDLNLKLMKWRIAPSLNLDAIKETKCLLLGAGTLGSYVSRNLLGWGVCKITFVDFGNVSFSNPVRQPLFNFKDCLEGGAKKALRAADALKEIYPGVDAQGYVLSVPMAGHPIPKGAEEKTQKEFETLRRLVDEHDVILLLMDSRESRWLPTVMGKSAGKIVLNAALGFDTYVVMRHGSRARGDIPGEEELGCYFCNDVVAPADSQKDATLDQQCTVTRPGIAPIASALLVELLASILQHPHRQHAAAAVRQPPLSSSSNTTFTIPSTSDPFENPLSNLPHTIRGYLSRFDNLLIKGSAYDCCSACSPGILQKYEEEGWRFVRQACDERGFVERVSGLEEVQRRAEEAMREIEMEMNEGDDDGDGEGELL